MELRYVDFMHEVNPEGSFAGRVKTLLGEQLLYKIPHAARLLDMSERKVWELVHTGKIESVQIGRSRRITRAALSSYIESLRSAA